MSHEPRNIESLHFLTRFTKHAVTSTVGVMMSQVNLMQSVEISYKLLMKHTDTKPEKERIIGGKENPIYRPNGLFYMPVFGQIKNAIYMKSPLIERKGCFICPFSAK